MTSLARAVALLLTATFVLGACAETVIEDPTADDRTSAEIDADGTASPESGDGPSGTPADLLASLGDAMQDLGNEIIDAGRAEDTTLAEIEEVWGTVRTHVETTYPELVDGFETTIEMAHTAVTRIRPADADKAYRLFLELLSRVDG